MVHYCTHLCQWQTILHSITAGIQWGSRELYQATILAFLIPWQALSSHPHQQMLWLWRLQDRDSVHVQYTILQHFTHNGIQWPTAARRWHFVLRDVSCRQSCHLSTPSHPIAVQPYLRQFQWGCWHSLKWSIADLLTSQSSSNVSLPFAWFTGPITDPSSSKYLWVGKH